MKCVFFLFLACLITGPLLAQSSMEQGETLYRQGKFSAALSEYETALKNYPNNPFVYYNIEVGS